MTRKRSHDSLHPHFEGLQREWVPASLPIDYRIHTEGGASPQEVWLTLHGFQQTGAYLFEKLKPAVEPGVVLLAPNAPFPIPMKEPNGMYRLGFSWYFYNPDNDSFFIDMELAIQSLVTLLERKNLSELPIRLIGFSQGGYLAPFLAEKLSRVIQVVGLGAEVLVDELRSLPGGWKPQYRLDGVHGAQDPIVTLEKSQKAFERAQLEWGPSGLKGEYCVIPQMGHGLKEAGLHELRRLLKLNG